MQNFIVIIVLVQMSFGLSFISYRIPKSIFNTIKCNLTTNIIICGKKNGAETFVSEGCIEYEKRLKPFIQFKTTFVKTDEDLVVASNNLKGKTFALDEHGIEYNSIQFSEILYKGFEDGGTHVNFIIGGYSGLPHDIKLKYPLISLSKMTWPHQFVRLLLTEQIYRAVEIKKGSDYHKD